MAESIWERRGRRLYNPAAKMKTKRESEDASAGEGTEGGREGRDGELERNERTFGFLLLSFTRVVVGIVGSFRSGSDGRHDSDGEEGGRGGQGGEAREAKGHARWSLVGKERGVCGVGFVC